MTTATPDQQQAPGSLPGPGVYYGMSEREYHALPYASKSKFWRLHKLLGLEFDPDRLKKKVLEERPRTDALELGRFVDDLLFLADRREIKKRYKVGPTKTRGTKAWQKEERWLIAHEIDRREDGAIVIRCCGRREQCPTLLTPEEVGKGPAMARSVQRHPIASQLLIHNKGYQQVTVIEDVPIILPSGEEIYLRCKGRIDRLVGYEGYTTHVDAKVCRNLDWFEKDARDYGYFTQNAHYRDLCELEDKRKGREPRNRRFIFAAIQNTPEKEAGLDEEGYPYHRVECFEYSEQEMGSAMRIRDSLLQKWAVLWNEGRYPGERPTIKPMYIGERAENQHAA